MGENILRKIGGQYIAEALNTLSDTEKSKEDFMETMIELPLLGLVRFQYTSA
ncbi:hypothetical protein [Nitrosospira lacus]|uniref:hypothetical protein n=1 Tax=Nitrosospira lacus TaxID=1288494 RepID=UPI0002C52D4E|nr:hypothetical protein [Nitrosospira lacus]